MRRPAATLSDPQLGRALGGLRALVGPILGPEHAEHADALNEAIRRFVVVEVEGGRLARAAGRINALPRRPGWGGR